MNLQITVPALFFPAISLTMLAYNARYLTIAGLIRELHKEYKTSKQHIVLQQIIVLRKRLKLIIATQGFAIISFIGCMITMFCIYVNIKPASDILFVISVFSMVISLVLLFIEILVSMNALKILLSTMEE